MREPTPEQVTRLCAAFNAATPARDACLYAGIRLADYHEWRGRGQKYQTALADDDATAAVLEDETTERVFLDFLDSTDQAMATAKVTLTGTVMSAVRAGDWRPAAWMLERLDPETFGRKVLQQVGDNDDGLASDVGLVEARLHANLEQYAADNGLVLESGSDDDVVEATIVEE